MKAPHPVDRFEIRLSGLGGQGLITLGRLLGSALALGHGYHVTQTQSYGPEARGGSSRADVVVSSRPISYPKTENLDLLVALSPEACNSYYRLLKKTGILLVDTTLVKHAPTNVYLGLPFTRLASEQIGNPVTINTMVMGAVTHLLPFADPRVVRKSLEGALPAKIRDVNARAFALGQKLARSTFGDAGGIWAAAERNGQHAEDDIIV